MRKTDSYGKLIGEIIGRLCAVLVRKGVMNDTDVNYSTGDIPYEQWVKTSDDKLEM